MSRKMNEDLFDFVLEHALADIKAEEINAIDNITEKVTLTQKGQRFFNDLVTKRKQHIFIAALPKRTKRVFIALAAAIATIVCLLFTQPPVRAAVRAVAYDWGDVFLDYKLTGSEQGEIAPYYGVKANWLPAGYQMTEAIIYPSSFSILYFHDVYYTGDGDLPEITIDIAYKNNSMDGGVDNEHGVLTPINLPGAENVTFIRCTEVGYWSYLLYTKGDFFFTISCPYDISPEEIVKISENIEILY